VNIKRQHFLVKLRSNKLASNNYADLLPIHIDEGLNEAHNFFLNKFAHVDQFPFEANSQRLEMLSTLAVGYPEQMELTPTKIENGLYELNYSNLKYEHAATIKAQIVCNSKKIPVVFCKKNELDKKIDDSFQKPSVKWSISLGTIRKSSTGNNTSLYIHVPEATSISSVRMEYIKKPKDVFFGGYNSADYLACIENSTESYCKNNFYHTGNVPVSSELPDQYHDLLVDIAVYLITGKTENINLQNIISNKINQIT